MITLVVLVDPRTRLRGAAHRVMWFLGDASYSIYLWHLFAQRLFGHAMPRFGAGNPQWRWLAMAAIVGGGIVLGSLVYVLVERPLLRRIKSWFAQRRAGRAAGFDIDPVPSPRQ